MQRRDPVNVHKNAKLTRLGRENVVRRWQSGETTKVIAQTVGVSPRTIFKWLKRFRELGLEGLTDRSSRPHRMQTKATEEQKRQIEALRRERRPFWKIAAQVGLSPATAARIGAAQGLSRLSALAPKEPIRRYEREAPGDMIHIDIKRLGRIDGIGHRITGDRTGQSNKRGTGWEYLHLAVDDHSRVAYSEILPDEKRKSCLTFLFNALRFFRKHGVKVQRVMTDNGVSFRSYRYMKALRMLKIKHNRTRPYTPKTNGKAERFVQTSLREWAYARAYSSSKDRANDLLPFLTHYNYHRPHFGLHGKTPMSRLPVNNLLRHDS